MAKKKKIDKASKPASYATEEFASESIPQQGSQKSRKKSGIEKRNNIICFKIADKEGIG